MTTAATARGSPAAGPRVDAPRTVMRRALRAPPGLPPPRTRSPDYG